MARLVRGVRSAAGRRRELMINTVWWRTESSLDDPVVRSGIQQATDFYIERGVEDTRRGQSYEGMLALIDRLHGLGLGVTLENYTAVDRFEAEYELASYLLHSDGRDAFGAEWASCPRRSRAYRPCRTSFWKGYRANLGRALGPRTAAARRAARAPLPARHRGGQPARRPGPLGAAGPALPRPGRQPAPVRGPGRRSSTRPDQIGSRAADALLRVRKPPPGRGRGHSRDQVRVRHHRPGGQADRRGHRRPDRDQVAGALRRPA